MIGAIPFGIPEEFASGLADGTLLRIGTLLKDSSTGQIVAHVQETGLAQNLLHGIGGSAFTPFAALDLTSSGLANFQLIQIKAMIQGLQLLQYTNLGVALAGIGISVIGFSMINKKLKGIEQQLSDFSTKIDGYFSDLSQGNLRQHYSQIMTMCEMADQALCLKDPAPTLLAVATQLGIESGYFRGEVVHLLEQQDFDTVLFSSMTRSYALCNAARIECLMLARELPSARKVAVDVGGSYCSLFDNLIPSRIARTMLTPEERGNESSSSKLKTIQREMTGLVQGVRDATDAARTKPYLMDTLMEREIDSFEYIKAVREEKENPIMLLRAQ